MKMIMGAINGGYLSDITESAITNTTSVRAAVAYATDMRLLFNWCIKNKKPLQYWGRLDPQVAVLTPILKKFLESGSSEFRCKLVPMHHAKVIWWEGYGVYIGSANLTDSAWYKNIEAGCFFEHAEITGAMVTDLNAMFAELDTHATQLTQELYDLMMTRARKIEAATPKDKRKQDAEDFWGDPAVNEWSGFSVQNRISAKDRNRAEFLREWNATLTDLRDIAKRVSLDQNRPAWVGAHVPTGSQADRFLHAYYRTQGPTQIENNNVLNRNQTQAALNKAIDWWRALPQPLHDETYAFEEAIPNMQIWLSEENINALDLSGFCDIVGEVHALREHIRQMSNSDLGLPANEPATREAKVIAFCQTAWAPDAGESVRKLLGYVLYGGEMNALPDRLWTAANDPDYKLPHVGIASLGELVGWAFPERFPPRNGPISKALRSLGYDVQVY